MPDTEAVNIVEKAFCQRKIMDSIKDIGFANSVISNQTVDFRAEFQVGLTVIFKVC